MENKAEAEKIIKILITYLASYESENSRLKKFF